MYAFEKKVTVRINEEQLAKIEDSGLNISDFLRSAIDTFNVEEENRLIEYHNQLLKEVEENLKEQQKSFKKELDEKYKNQEKTLISELNSRKKEFIDTHNEKQQKYIKQHEDKEEKFLEILPTLQALKRRHCLNDNHLKIQALKINVSPKELKQWIRNNHELLNGNDYLYNRRGNLQ